MHPGTACPEAEMGSAARGQGNKGMTMSSGFQQWVVATCVATLGQKDSPVWMYTPYAYMLHVLLARDTQ
jgi:hypothetical protein